MSTQGSAQFTPGPWIAALGERLNTDVYHRDKQGNRVFVAEFATQADAVLGAAAPAMYEALKAMLALSGDEDLPDNGELSGASICDFARNALAQAEGRQA